MSKKNIEQGFKDAEALGQLKTLPKVEEQPSLPEIEPEKVARTVEDFRLFLGRAQISGVSQMEVSKDVFHFLTKGQDTDSITFGDPGVEIFIEGTVEDIMKVRRMKAEDYHNHIHEQKRAAQR